MLRGWHVPGMREAHVGEKNEITNQLCKSCVVVFAQITSKFRDGFAGPLPQNTVRHII